MQNNPFNNYPYNYQPSYYKTYPQNTYAFVNGIEGAKSFQMLPNQTMLLMDSDSLMCYMKKTNDMGQATLRAFKLEEVTTEKTASEFVTREDFDTLSKKLDAIVNKLEGDKQDAKSVQ